MRPNWPAIFDIRRGERLLVADQLLSEAGLPASVVEEWIILLGQKRPQVGAFLEQIEEVADQLRAEGRDGDAAELEGEVAWTIVGIFKRDDAPG
jgi:hypothetical protein